MTTETVLPELVGTLANLPEHTQATIRAYGAACARTALESSEVQAPKWISVEDRLPPNDEIDVIALHGGSETELVWGWLIHETHADRTYSHWIPLPPPPQHDNQPNEEQT